MFDSYETFMSMLYMNADLLVPFEIFHGSASLLKFEIKLEWLDHRITYSNLKENRYYLNVLNETDHNRIWLPLIVYQNTDQFETTRLGLINEWSTNIMIAREGNFKR